MLVANGGAVAETIGSLFTRRGGAGGGRGAGDGGSGGGGRGGAGSGSWRPRRVVIFQPSAASPEEDARALERELATLAGVALSPPSSERGGGGGHEDSAAVVEVVKPLWLVDSVGSFRILKPTVTHRV